MRSHWRLVALTSVVPLLGAFTPVQAQDWAGFEAQSLLCSQTRSAAACRVALDRSHLLKRWAEQRELLRCYTALLGAEARMIAGSAQDFAELQQLCNR